jgi:Regulator of G protein signaling domain
MPSPKDAGGCNDMEKLVKIMEDPKEIEILKEIADNQNILHYITFFEKYKEVLDLSLNVNNTIEQQVVRKKVKDLAREYLFDEAPKKIPLSAEVVVRLTASVNECGGTTYGNRIDISFLQPVTRHVLALLAATCLPNYKKAAEPKYSVVGRGIASKLFHSKSSNKLGHLGSSGSMASLHNQGSLPALPSESSPQLIHAGTALRGSSELRPGSVRPSETLEHLISVLNTPIELILLKKIVEKQHSMENLDYYQRQKLIKEYAASNQLGGNFRILTASAKSLLHLGERMSAQNTQVVKDMIRALANDFIVEGAPQELNISAKVRYEFEDKFKKEKISLEILDPVTKEVLNNILLNSFSVYKKLKARDKIAVQDPENE